jgi:sodium transport system permease protein
VITLACAAGILRLLPLEDLGVRFDSLGALSLGVLGAGIPLALLAAALQVAAATLARTFKEGQTYLSMLLFLPMIAGMLLAFSQVQPAPWRLAVPVIGQHQLISAVIRGDTPSAYSLLMPALVATVVTTFLLRRIAALLSSDRILYG